MKCYHVRNNEIITLLMHRFYNHFSAGNKYVVDQPIMADVVDEPIMADVVDDTYNGRCS